MTKSTKIRKEKSPGPDTVSCCGARFPSTQQNFKSLFTCPKRCALLFTENPDALIHWRPTWDTQVVTVGWGVLNHFWDQQPRQLQSPWQINPACPRRGPEKPATCAALEPTYMWLIFSIYWWILGKRRELLATILQHCLTYLPLSQARRLLCMGNNWDRLEDIGILWIRFSRFHTGRHELLFPMMWGNKWVELWKLSTWETVNQNRKLGGSWEEQPASSETTPLSIRDFLRLSLLPYNFSRSSSLKGIICR